MNATLRAAPVAHTGAERVIMRAAVVAGIALSLVAGSIGVAEAAPRHGFFFFSPSPGWAAPARPMRAVRSVKRPKKPRADAAMKSSPEKQGFLDMPKGVQQIVVSIGSQRVTLFSNGERVAQAPVSTGTKSHPTPLGVFSIIEKDRYHRSNLYGNAPMFFMQRLTWSGVAMHEGPLPGYPASHGCIRLTTDFAARLWPTTKLGVRVIVARGELAPVEFSHPTLFVPSAKPAEPKVAMNVMTDGRVALPLQMGEAISLESEKTNRLEPSAAVTPVTEASSAPINPGELRQSIDVPELAKPNEDFSSPVPASAVVNDTVKPVPESDPLKPAPIRFRADQPIKHRGQVAVFVSRKEKKVFVRQGFIPLFEMPISIDDADKPLGTHVFTAMERTEDGAGMRWNLLTVPSEPRQLELTNKKTRGKEAPRPDAVVERRSPSSAAEALDRIRMPAAAVNRISDILIPGSSLIVSDEGLGRETGRQTEFIVLTR